MYTHYSYSYSYFYSYLYFSALLLIPSIRTPLFFPSISALSTYTLYSYLYSYTFIFTPLFLLPLLLLPSLSTSYYSPPLYVYIICTPFSQKIFPKKISTPKAYPKIFTYYNYSSPLLFNRKVNSSYSFYKILNTKFWRLYETIKTNGKNYYDFR